ncbi:TadE/TadG family type IV pilus assembly protein [Kiloniella sp. EL199]|uniref:TadE/TadG family type IV pilus assembly protein n=1 Tax=Kiloniella sp. EL199 TaxID=2107581 RepID=UPI000EA12E3A|nr:TadE/TadG family type IV pilus assembly protein [Kiloniella sp. EL199]
MPLYKLIKRIKRSRFAKCDKGVVALEYALGLPVFLTMVLGIFDLGGVYFASILLEGGLREAARYGVTGNLAPGVTKEEKILETINFHGAGFVQVKADELSTLVYKDFDSIGDPEPYVDADGNNAYDAGEAFTDLNCNGAWDSDSGFDGAGNGSEVVLYTVEHETQLITGYIAHLVGKDGKVKLRASVAVRNEPYGGGASC